jgi:hypothetical protein
MGHLMPPNYKHSQRRPVKLGRENRPSFTTTTKPADKGKPRLSVVALEGGVAADFASLYQPYN